LSQLLELNVQLSLLQKRANGLKTDLRSSIVQSAVTFEDEDESDSDINNQNQIRPTNATNLHHIHAQIKQSETSDHYFCMANKEIANG
jgi:hypothetical protein